MTTRSTYTDGESVFARWSWRGWGYRHDLIDRDYMERWTLYTPVGMLRLHHILRSDNDRHFHDHPFDFLSLILKGGYIEHRPGRPGGDIYIPGHVLARRAEDLHYLKLLGKDAWTLVFASRPRRRWGFATENGWIDAADYDEYLDATGQRKARA